MLLLLVTGVGNLLIYTFNNLLLSCHAKYVHLLFEDDCFIGSCNMVLRIHVRVWLGRELSHFSVLDNNSLIF